MDQNHPTITVTRRGPLELRGDGVMITDHLGIEIDLASGTEPATGTDPDGAESGTRLCRCGGSGTKPLCDQTHRENGFVDAKADDRIPDRLDRHVGVAVTIGDNRGTCANSGLCTDRLDTVFHRDAEPFATPNGARSDEIVAAARRCPSGALQVRFDPEVVNRVADPDRKPEIVVSKDGPYHLRGGVRVVDEHGDPIERNRGASHEHAALCRCGASKNKPFCSGAHRSEAFSDPPEPSQPTIFEWAGGYPAIVDALSLFYGKLIPADDLLQPVFLHMSADHPERVGAWLGEVFGGPARYSETMGGYSAMIAHHLGRALDEPKRKRWVALFVQAMDEVGMSNNAEFRAAVISYLEWGTRIAVENSQQGAEPPANMPMPRWTWTTAAGHPQSRASALDEAEPDHLPTLPADDEEPSFARHVSTLFRQRDIESMRWAFDLSDYDDVVDNAERIAARLGDGSMPPDQPWPDEHLQVFQRWRDRDHPR